MLKKAYQINFTSLLAKQVEIAAFNTDEAAKKQIECEIEEDVKSYQSVQYYYTCTDSNR